MRNIIVHTALLWDSSDLFCFQILKKIFKGTHSYTVNNAKKNALTQLSSQDPVRDGLLSWYYHLQKCVQPDEIYTEKQRGFFFFFNFYLLIPFFSMTHLKFPRICADHQTELTRVVGFHWLLGAPGARLLIKCSCL